MSGVRYVVFFVSLYDVLKAGVQISMHPQASKNKLTTSPKTSLGVKVWLFMVALPTVAFLAATLLTEYLPGCRCDSGSGCYGCGLDDVVAFCLFGGLIGSIAAFMFCWPVIFIVNFFASLIKPIR